MQEWAIDGFQRWANFPLGACPRPVIFLDRRVRIGGGFPDAQSKSAWLDAHLRLAVDLPGSVVDLITDGRGMRPSDNPLVVERADRVKYDFRCDRGVRSLPAYALRVTSMLGDCIVLDPEVELWWPRFDADRPGVGSTAYLGDDGQTVRFPAHGGVLTIFHHAQFREFDAYAVGRAITSERTVAPGRVIPSIRIGAWVTGQLGAPLGDRVLVDEVGGPLQVLPESDASQRDRQCWKLAP